MNNQQSIPNNKMFSLESEQIVQQLKDRVEQLAQAIKSVVYPPQSEIIIKITCVNIVDIISEHKTLLELFVNLLILANTETRNWALYSEYSNQSEEYLMLSDKSLKYQMNINSVYCQRESGSILMYLSELIREQSSNLHVTDEYMELLTFAFKFIDFKNVNIETCELICNNVKDYIYLAIQNNQHCVTSKEILEKLLYQQFYSEVNIKNSADLFTQCLCKLYSEEKSSEKGEC